jgi:hypothetical protein
MKKAYGTFTTSVVATAILGCLSVAAVESQQQSSQEKPKGTAGTAMTVRAGEIANNPSRYYGQKVTVRAEVEDVLSRQVFVLDEDKLFAYPDVLVIAPALSSMVPEDQIVTVTGTVRAFVDADFRRDYDWNWWGDLDNDIIVTFRDRPVIVADSIRTQSGTELVTQKKP